MSESVDLTKKDNVVVDTLTETDNLLINDNMEYAAKADVPQYNELQNKMNAASSMISDIVLKNYLSKLTEFEVIPLDESFKQISDIRFFKINEMVYQNDEYSTYKFASVFNSVQNLNCGVYIIMNSDGKKTDFYMGVRSLDNRRTTSSLKDTLKNALVGQFPGVKTKNILDSEAVELLSKISSKNLVSVSCVAKNKDDEIKENQKYLQGLEKLALAMQGQSYTAIVLATSTSPSQLAEIRSGYESIYTSLSPFANSQISYSSSSALSISEALTHGTNFSNTHTDSITEQIGMSKSETKGGSSGYSQQDMKSAIGKTLGKVALGIASVATAPLTGGASLAAAGVILAGQVGLEAISPKTYNESTSYSEQKTTSESHSTGSQDSETTGENESETQSKGATNTSGENLQLTLQNKTLLNAMDKIDEQLKRLDECESLGMWECAAYFMADNQETAEMAAGTYKAIMKGENSGIETSAINFWGGANETKLPLLREYVTNFLHPVFKYENAGNEMLITPSTLVSGNEMAIQMGLPRKSVCGFPVIQHADFGKEIVKYGSKNNEPEFILGKIYNMGEVSDVEGRLRRDSLTMHTFVTGSTGSGKSNTVYEILKQLKNIYNIPFMVIEPAKGEYKNIFGQYADVSVYGTNPKKYEKLLRINPFSFPEDIHILEHIDRLVEIFNVCWPMYAAMPAILKEAIENAYKTAGWDLCNSINDAAKFPNFADILTEITEVINNSAYSSDSKGDYIGALCTRVRSLTTGLNGLIFSNNAIMDDDLFDKSVIIDLSRVGSTETKSLIMGLLVMKLNEYRMSSSISNSKLRHITVLEEAHNILKRTSTEQSSESSNLLGKSVELLSNSIAEMRTYGEGFIIADQAPGLLDLSVIRNTNTKIVLRLPEKSDRDLVGHAANLNDEQINELAKLERGVAAVYQNDWVEPVLIAVNKCKIIENTYLSANYQRMVEPFEIRKQIINLLIQGRLGEKLDFDVNAIEQNIDVLNLSSSDQEFVEEIIDEYKHDGSLAIWIDADFYKLACRVTTLLGVRDLVENIVVNSADNNELTDKLSTIIKKSMPDASDTAVLVISQCLLKDMSAGKNETEVREAIYKDWYRDKIAKRR